MALWQALQLIVLQRERKAQLDTICSLRARLITSDTTQTDLQRRVIELQQRVLIAEDQALSLKAELRQSHLASHVGIPTSASCSSIETSTQPSSPSQPPTLLWTAAPAVAPTGTLSAEPRFSEVAPSESTGTEHESQLPMLGCCPGSRAALQRASASAFAARVGAGAPAAAEGTAATGGALLTPPAEIVCVGDGAIGKQSADTLSASSTSSLPSTVNANGNGQSPSMLDLLCTAAHIGGGGIGPDCDSIEVPPSALTTAMPASLASLNASRAKSSDAAEGGISRKRSNDSELGRRPAKAPAP